MINKNELYPEHGNDQEKIKWLAETATAQRDTIKRIVRRCKVGLPASLVVILFFLFLIALIYLPKFAPLPTELRVETSLAQATQAEDTAKSSIPVIVTVNCDGQKTGGQPSRVIIIRPVTIPYVVTLTALTAVLISAIWALIRVLNPDDF